VLGETDEYYEVEWDVVPTVLQNGARKVSTIPKGHAKPCDEGCSSTRAKSFIQDDDEDNYPFPFSPGI
jgi:hypothetical protein